MYIDELNIRGYGMLSGFRLEPTEGLNVLFGPASSGKTSVCNCLRDLLLGPGRWETDEGGPQAPHARPRGGDRFQARLRYRVGDARFTVQRDFEDSVMRVRDDVAGAEVPVADASGAAQGVVPFHLDREMSEAPSPTPGSEGLLREVREREAAARAEAAGWEYRYAAATVSELEKRMAGAAAIGAEMEPMCAALERLAPHAEVARELRDGVIRASERVRAAEHELAETCADLEREAARHTEAMEKLAPFAPYGHVTEADLTLLKSLQLSEGVAAHVAEKAQNLEGFRRKKADVDARLAELEPRFADVTDHDAFEVALADQERDLHLSEKLDRKNAEALQVRGSMQAASGATHRWLALGALVAVGGGALIGFGIAPAPGGVAGILGLGMLAQALAVRERARAMESDQARIAREVEALQAVVEQARRELRRTIESVGVHTILEVRTLHRELRATRRDQQTVRAYLEMLERDLEAARREQAGQATETPAFLMACGQLGPSDVLTSRVVADFFESYHRFLALRQEEEAVRVRQSELTAERDLRGREVEVRREELQRALSAVGVTSESELEAAVSGRREHERLKAQVEVLEGRKAAILHGADEAEVARLLATGRERLRAIAESFPQVTSRVAADDTVEGCREKVMLARQEVAVLQGEIAGLEGSAALRGSDEEPSGAGPGVSRMHAEPLERSVAASWERVTGRPLRVSLRERHGDVVILAREREDEPWLSCETLGAGAARLLRVLLEGERARVGGPGALPAIVDNPLSLLASDWQDRLVEWLIALSAEVQVFVTLSMPERRDRLREGLRARGMTLRETQEGALEVFSALPATRAQH